MKKIRLYIIAGTLLIIQSGILFAQEPNQPPVVNITSPVSGSVFTAPATITIMASAYDPDGGIAKVEFFNGYVKLGEDAFSPYSFTWNNVPMGNYSIRAAATDDFDALTASPFVSISVTPVPPVYVSSVVNNATPSILEMTYSLSLADVVPAASAFNVQVNAVSRFINTVTISGTNVSLFLATPVVYGDVITVSYTRPATNHLQGPTGAPVSSMTSQPVINNVAPSSAGVPIVTTNGTFNITNISAQSLGNVSNDGGSYVTARGSCWSTSSNPTVSGNHTVDGNNIGSFASYLYPLAQHTTYYVRAYATNSFGTAYGTEISFTTYKSEAITDYDGNYYNIVTIGSQVWMAENLKTTKYNDGSAIPNVTDNAEWDALTSPAYAWYENNLANKSIYGALYNWYAGETDKLCPVGWHVPTDGEWTTLTNYVGGESVGGGKLKEIGTTHWNSPNDGATNEYGFTALPGGARLLNGVFYSIGDLGSWWSSIDTLSTYAWHRFIWNNLSHFDRIFDSKADGFSVRCIKDGQLTATITGTSSVCKDAAYPNITFTGANGTAPYTFTYKINGGSDLTITTTSVNSVTVPVPTVMAGTYTYSLVSVTDADAAVLALATGTAVVTVNPLPTATISGTSTVCKDAASPNITFTGASGTSPYIFTYNINSGSNQTVTTTAGNSVTMPVPTGSTGIFTYALVSVRDSSSTACSQAQTGTAIVTVNPLPTATISGSISVCKDATSPNITFTGASGTAPYTFTYIINGGSNQTVTTTVGNSVTVAAPTGTAGTFIYALVNVRDASTTTCSQAQSGSATITVNPLPVGTTVVTNVLCFGGNNGEVNLTIAEGTIPYTFLWSNGATTEDLTNITAGTYSVSITDVNTCQATASATVIQPPVISVTPVITNVSCNHCSDAAIEITTTGGTGGYSYAWTGPDGFTSNLEDIVSLKPGTYNLTVTDASNCTQLFTYEVINPSIVTNVADNGSGSLRYALEYANLNPGKDTIIFNIPGTGPFTIQPFTAQLPQVTDPVIIDGFTQPGTSATDSKLLIEISGENLGEFSNGLYIKSGNSTVSGLVINRFQGAGIYLESNNNIVKGNYLGTDLNGVTGYESNGTGIFVDIGASNNKIGGTTLTERNIISGNNVGIFLNESIGSLVLGNYIGVDVTGKKPLGNETSGLKIDSGRENIIGGTNTNERNIISSNLGNGILIEYGSSTNSINGNYIGTDVSGKLPMGNAGAGIMIASGNENIIGGINTSEGNLISDNKVAGISIQSNNNKISGNYLGTDYTGLAPLGNQVGVKMSNGASGNQIGDFIKGGGNIIAFSKEQGILIADAGTTGNTILSNSIHSNGSLGIDLGQDGTVTENDDDDPDTGANNQQNFPVLDSIKYDLGNRAVFISGSLNSIPSNEFTIQFFASRIGDSNGYGEGRTFLGSKKVTTAADGNVLFADILTLYSSWGDLITATATDSAGNTSEFSMGIGGLQDQILADINRPFYFTMNEEGHPNITNGSDLLAIENSFKIWTEIPTADIQFISKGTTSAKYASANDKVNLVSFTDDKFPFPPGVLAIAAKTLKIIPGNDTARIIDADIVFNPVFLNHPEIKFGIGEGAGVYDIQSITTHEIGHILGLLHSGVVNSTMFYMLGPGITVRSLEQDDRSWASYRYPEQQAYDNIFGSISGTITYGYGADDDPVAGALVLATDTATGNSVHAYSDAYGDYHVPGLVPGPYEIYIEPLDGNVSGYKLRPGNISLYIYCNTIYTDYANEFYSGDTESAYENQDSVIVFEVSAGSETTGMDIITNRDRILPSVLSVLPDKTDSVDINQIFKITFSEPVDEKTLTGETCYLTSAGDTLTGDFYREGDDSHIMLFTPKEAMTYSTEYTLIVTDSITDLKANHLASAFQFTFTTIPPDAVPPQITYTRPTADADSVFVIEKIIVTFSEPMDKYSVEDGFALKWTEGGTGSEPIVIKEMDCSPIWDNKNTEVTFVPSGTLLEGTEYTVSLSGGITDLSGLALKDTLFAFETVAQANPVILYLGPKDFQTGATVKTPVVVEFSEPVNPVSVNSESIKLLLVQGTVSSRVTGSFEFLNENSLVLFRPDSDLVSNQQYTVIITEEILDVSQPALNLPDSSVTVFTTAGVVPPQIDNLVPMSGVPGILVTINGSGFDPDPSKNTVLFNGISVQVVDASLTYVRARVPIGAVTGPVKVQVEGSGLSNDFRDFVVLPVSLQPCDELVSNVSTGTSGKDVELDSNASFAYVTNPDAGTVSVVNLKTMTITDVIPVGKTPLKIDIHPDDTKAYVTNFGSDDVSVIDLKAKSVIKTIPVGRNPYGIVVTPDGDHVYVANYSSPFLSVIDADSTSGGFNHVVANVSTGTDNKEITVTGDAGLVLVTGNDGLKIVCSNPSDLRFNTVVSNVSSGTVTNDVAVTGDAGYALVTIENNTILFVDINPKSDLFGAAVANVSTSTQPGDIVISGDAMFVYVTNTDADKISVYKLSYGGTGTTNGSFGSYPTLLLHNEIAVKDSIAAPEGLAIDPMNQRLFVVNSGAETHESSLAVIRICCGPVAPTNSIGELVITIQTMINLEIVQEAIGLELIGHLNSTLAYYTADKIKSAINKLNTFISKVKDLVKSGRITKEQGQALIDAANAIIAQMKAPQPSLTESPEVGTNTSGDPDLFNNTEFSSPEMISESRLGVIYPNPFSEEVTINYEISESDANREKVLLRVYDVSGRLVGTLVNKSVEQGSYMEVWSGNYDSGSPAPYGTYFVVFKTGDVMEVREILLMRR
jgi:uncharacterized protein (TIGR02145 family)